MLQKAARNHLVVWGTFTRLITAFTAALASAPSPATTLGFAKMSRAYCSWVRCLHTIYHISEAACTRPLISMRPSLLLEVPEYGEHYWNATDFSTRYCLLEFRQSYFDIRLCCYRAHSCHLILTIASNASTGRPFATSTPHRQSWLILLYLSRQLRPDAADISLKPLLKPPPPSIFSLSPSTAWPALNFPDLFCCLIA